MITITLLFDYVLALSPIHSLIVKIIVVLLITTLLFKSNIEQLKQFGLLGKRMGI